MPLPGMELEIEITESCIQTGEHTLQTARALKSMGLTLAIDDFGTGYSSLVSLQQLPIDRIKIDGSFIKRLPADTNDATITAAMIAMGKALGLRVLAEGVETSEQLEFLRAHGCDEAQGYLFSRGLAAEAFRELVTRRRVLISRS
jgi:EAL domain-containing protein (putative c-di-GMP-specific phosphodiesterase class I)